MDPAIMKELNIYSRLFLIGLGTRFYSQGYTHVYEIAKSSNTTDITYVLVILYLHTSLATGCTYFTPLHARSKGIEDSFHLNFIVPVHCLISIGFLAQLEIDGVAHIHMVGNTTRLERVSLMERLELILYALKKT
jgi:hypothetical protein